jgi:hypothetical protein
MRPLMKCTSRDSRSSWTREETLGRKERPDSAGRSQCLRIAKGHHPLPVLIPQCEAHTGEAVPEIEPANLPQRGMIAQDLRKPIERNAARQVMHVMHADIAGEPTERRR